MKQNFRQIIDENIAAQNGDPRQLRFPGFFEIDAIPVNAQVVGIEETAGIEPARGGVPKVRPLRIEMPVAGLMTDDADLTPAARNRRRNSATPSKGVARSR